jgi:hypothetical protein
MAEVTRDVTADVDWLLDYLLAEWEDIPNIAREWPAWTTIDRIHALIDWPVVESNLRALEDYAAQDILTPAQTERYTRLHALVTKYRPLLQRLMQD